MAETLKLQKNKYYRMIVIASTGIANTITALSVLVQRSLT